MTSLHGFPYHHVVYTGFSPTIFNQLQKRMQNKQIYGMIESKKQKVQEG